VVRDEQAWGLAITAGLAVLAALVAALWMGGRDPRRSDASQQADPDTHASTTVMVEAIAVPASARPAQPPPPPASPKSP